MFIDMLLLLASLPAERIERLLLRRLSEVLVPLMNSLGVTYMLALLIAFSAALLRSCEVTCLKVLPAASSRSAVTLAESSSSSSAALGSAENRAEPRRRKMEALAARGFLTGVFTGGGA